MNVKHRGRWTKYKGFQTIKKRPYLLDANQNIKHFVKKPHIKTRTYNRINNIVIHRGYSGHGTHMIGGGKDDTKNEEKARKEEEKRVLKEEKEKQKAAKKAEDEKAKKDKKEKEEAAKIKANEEKAKKDAEKKDQNKTSENEKGANKAGNKTQPVATNNKTNGPKLNIAGVTDTETEENKKGELKENKVTQETSKVLKLDGTVPGANVTDVDTESVTEPAGNKPAPAGNKPAPAGNKVEEPTGNKVKSDNKTKEGEAKKGRWASFKETMKKGASNAAGYITQKAKNLGNGIKKVAWGDENTGKLGKAGRLLASPFSLPLTGLYKAAKGSYKLGVSAKDRAGLFVKRLRIPESMRLVKKFNTWKTTRKAATGELKKQKYEDKFAKKKEEISGYSQEIMLLESKGEKNLTDEEKKKLKKLRSKINSAEYELDLISIKNARWKTRSAKSKLELNKLQESRILPSTKNKINNKIQQKQDDMNKHFQQSELNIKKNVATRVANLDTDTDFKAELAGKEKELDAELAEKIKNNPAQKDVLTNQYAGRKAALAQKLKYEKEQQFQKDETLKLAGVKKAAQTQIYSDQINDIATKLGVNIDAKNPQLKAILEQHHADPTAKPLTGDELIKKVSEVGFSNIIANKQTVAQANKYLSAPQAVFKAGDEQAAIAKLGSNTAKQSFYKEYVRDARNKLDDKLTELSKTAAGKNSADAKVKLTRLKAQLETMDKDKRFKSADQDLYLYNLLKPNEKLLGISTINKVNEANNAKSKITDPAKRETAITAYYNARTKPLDAIALKKLAALYNPELKKLVDTKQSIIPARERHYIQTGLDNYREHIQKMLTDNPLALKVENPAIYNQIFYPQKSTPSTTNNNISKMVTIHPPSAVTKNNNESTTSQKNPIKKNNITKSEFSDILFKLYSSIYSLLDANKQQIFKKYTNTNGLLKSEYNEVIYTKFKTENKQSINDKIYVNLLRETWVNYQDCIRKTDENKKELIYGNKYSCDFYDSTTNAFKEVDIRYIIRNLLMNYYISPFIMPPEKRNDLFSEITDELLKIIQQLH